MSNSAEELSPLAAYEELMRFANKCGEAPLRLALHASVPQGFHPDLLHLLKRNFVSEAGDDPTTEVDVLFSPICEDLGRGFFRFDPQVRTLLLDNLASNYANEPKSRIYRVANFLLFYVDHFDRSTTGSQDQLWRDYLEMQRWVAFAFVSPESAARQLAAALENADSSQNFAARMQLGGLASALVAPLVGYRGLLKYAAGLQKWELGNYQEAEEFFADVTEHDLKVGDTVLRPAAKIIEEWRKRNPGASAEQPSGPAEEVSEPDEPVSVSSGKFDEAITSLESELTEVRRRGVELLGDVNAPAAAVPALIRALNDPESSVGLAAIQALAVIGNEAAIAGLVVAVNNPRRDFQFAAIKALTTIGKGIALILGRFMRERESLAEAIQEGMRRRNYVAIFLGDGSETDFAAVVSYSKFIIADITDPRRVRSQLKAILPSLKIPVQPIVQGRASVYPAFSELQHYSSLLKPHRYEAGSDLLSDLAEKVIPSLELWVEEVGAGVIPEPGPQPAVFEYDIYISYAHADNQSLTDEPGWVDAFHKSLDILLSDLIGDKPKIWRDFNLQLQGNEALANSANIQLSRTAFFICVLSPRYLNSSWCVHELTEFFERAPQTGGIMLANRSRIFKVVKTPIRDRGDLLEAALPPGKLLSLLRETLGYEFYEMGGMPGEVREFDPPSGRQQSRRRSGNKWQFLERLEDLAQDIKEAMSLLRASQSAPVEQPRTPRWTRPITGPSKTVFLASTTYALNDERVRIELELKARGYRVLPDRPLPLAMAELRDALRGYLEQSDLSVHLIGEDYGIIPEMGDRSLPDIQYRMAAERHVDPSFSHIVWMPPGTQPDSPRQQRFVEELKTASRGDLLQGGFEALKTYLLDSLQKTTAPERFSKVLSIYLIDTPRDAEISLQIQRYLSERRFEVLRSAVDLTPAKVLRHHREMLVHCDAVIIEYCFAERYWLEMRLREVEKARGYERRAPFVATSVYIGGDRTQDKEQFRSEEHLVIKNFGEFYPASIDPFMAALH